MIRLSIIIPFYNVEKYISQCLDSVVNQDLPLSDYEIICVNDASPDHSRDIVLEYMKQYPNIRLIEHEHNKKLGAARNTGRSIAQGKYIWNVDSDDIIEHNCLKRLISICEHDNLDVLRIGHGLLNNSNETAQTFRFQDTPVLSGIDFMKQYGIRKIGDISPIWLQIYNRSFLDKNMIFSPEINMGEDVPFTLETFILAARIKCSYEIAYYYRPSNNSLTQQLKKHPSPNTVYENCFVCSKYIYKLFQITRKDRDIFCCLKRMTKYIIMKYTTALTVFSEKEKAEFKSMCRHNLYHNLYILRCLSLKEMAEYLTFLLR